MSSGRRPYTRSVARAAASSSATETQTIVNTQLNSTDAARSRRERKPKKFTNQSEDTTQIQEATTFTNQIPPEEAAGSGSVSTKQIPIISRSKRGRKPKTEIENPKQNEQAVLSNENEHPSEVTRAESSQQIVTTQQIPIIPHPKRGRKPKNTLPVEMGAEAGTVISEQNEQSVLPNELVEVGATRVDPNPNPGSGSAFTQQITIVSRPKRGRKPKNDSPVIGTEIENPKQNEQVALPSEKSVDIDATSAENSREAVIDPDPVPDLGSASTRQVTIVSRQKRGRKPKKFTDQCEATTQIQEATSEIAAGSNSISTQQIPIISHPKRGQKPKSSLRTRTETETFEQNEQLVSPSEQPAEVMRAESSQQVVNTQQIPIVSRPKRGRKPKNTSVETGTETGTIIPEQNEQMALPIVEVDAMRADLGSQQVTIISRPKRGRKPKKIETEIENPEQNEQMVLPSEQLIEVEVMRAEGSRQVVTDPRRKQKPGNTSSQNAEEPVNVPIEDNDFNESIISKRGRKRKAVTEDSIAADQITSNSNADGGLPNPSKRGRKNLSKQKPEVQVESIEASGSSVEITTSNNRGLKRKEVAEDNKPKTKKPKEPKKPEEKRQFRIKKICPASVRERIYRAESQRIYMVSRTVVNETKQEFVVLGSTGNVYTVTISHTPNCTCPDFLKGNLCKHIIFVYLRVLRLNRDSMYIYQKALLTDELKKIFANAAPDPTIMANERVRNRYKEFTSGSTPQSDEKRRPIEGDCPICYEPLEEKDRDSIVWCKDGCGNNLHKDCFVQWKKSKRGGTVTCVYCRVEWIESNYGNAVLSSEGYVNLGNVQGMSLRRDTSTYYRPNRYTQGSWY